MRQKRLPTPIKKKVNKALLNLTRNKYFSTIPLKTIETILSENDIILLQEDYTPWSGLLLGDASKVSIVVGDKNDIVRKLGFVTVFASYVNTSLELSWYRMPSGKFEINIYIA